MSDKAKLKRYNGSGFTEVYPLTTHDQIVASGTRSSSTFLRGDGVWATPTNNFLTSVFGGTGNSTVSFAREGLSTLTLNLAHAHGNINSSGAIGTTASLPIITTTSGVLTTGSFGTTAGTFAQGNDARLSDARTPLAHTHGDISNAGAIATTAVAPASNDYIIISDSSASNVLKRGILINSIVPDGTFLANNGSMLVASVSKRYTLGSAVTSSLTTFGSTGITFPLVANKYYMVQFNGGIFSAATTTGFGLSVTTSSTTGTPTVRGMFNISSNSTTGGSAAHFQGSFVTMSTTAGTSLNGILGLDNANSAGTPSFVNFSAVMYSGSSVDKTMTIQLRSEIAGSLVTLIAGSTVVVTELTT